MASDTVIAVESLGKQYWLQHRHRPDTLRDSIVGAVRRIGERIRGRNGHAGEEEFWALRDVSFEVKRGEVVGIIGRNGAGKSTLLKILSRITEPTTGTVRLRGRVVSLLEVGTGFHPELSGRDNIFLNGAILGMSRAEIRRKFDEIVAFAEVEKFLDMRVKHYSSGMYVRLAFAVAAHLEPEILIVDEVLAVGDIAFQNKCLAKMQNVASGEGRTILFVSHNLHAIRQLCRSAVLLASGRVQEIGSCAQVIDVYQHRLIENAPVFVPAPPPELTHQAYVTSVAVETLEGQPAVMIPVGKVWRIRIGLRVINPQRHFVVALGLKGADGIAVQTAWVPPQDLAPGSYEATFTQSRVVLEAGAYTLILGLSSRDISLQQFEAARLEFTEQGHEGYFPRTYGVGIVLNSMDTDLRQA